MSAKRNDRLLFIYEETIMDLSLVPMEEIWDEIKRRSDTVIMVELKSLDSEREAAQIAFKGGRYACLGLLQYASSRLIMESLHGEQRRGEA